MRLAVLVETFSPPSETFIYDYLLGLEGLGVDVSVLALGRCGQMERPFSKVESVDEPGRGHIARLAADWSPAWLLRRFLTRLSGGITQAAQYDLYRRGYRRRLSQILRRMAPDVLHAQFGPMGWLAAPVARRLGIPLVVSFHGQDASQFLRQRIWRRRYLEVFAAACAVLGPSESLLGRLRAAGAAPERLVLLRNGLNLEHIRYSDPTQRFDGREIRLLSVGRLVAKKDPLTLVRAFAQCCKSLRGGQSPTLTLAGAGPLLAAVTTEIRHLGIGSSVRLRGVTSHPEVVQLLGWAHVYAQHSITAPDGDMEGLPVTVTEASAAGLPVVATRHSGIPEAVEDGVSGYLVDEGDEVGMAAAMVRLCREPHSWPIMGRAGRRLMEESFDASLMAARALSVLETARRSRSLERAWPGGSRE